MDKWWAIYPPSYKETHFSPVLFYVNEEIFDQVNAAVNTMDIYNPHTC